jgi:hypothetical protein
MQLSTAEIENIFSLVAPASLDPSQLSDLANLVANVRSCADLHIHRQLLLRLIMGDDSIRYNLRTPAYTEDKITAIDQLRLDIRYKLYQATMSALKHKPLDKRQWRSGTRFINDKPEQRQPASFRWRELLRNGHKIGDHVTNGSSIFSGRLTNIEADCMVTLVNGTTFTRTSPGSLKTALDKKWLDKN